MSDETPGDFSVEQYLELHAAILKNDLDSLGAEFLRDIIPKAVVIMTKPRTGEEHTPMEHILTSAQALGRLMASVLMTHCQGEYPPPDIKANLIELCGWGFLKALTLEMDEKSAGNMVCMSG